jgi:hypothetical protein
MFLFKTFLIKKRRGYKHYKSQYLSNYLEYPIIIDACNRKTILFRRLILDVLEFVLFRRLILDVLETVLLRFKPNDLHDMTVHSSIYNHSQILHYNNLKEKNTYTYI